MSVSDVGARRLRLLLAWVSWTAALAALVIGLLRVDAGWVRAGGYLLLLAALLDAVALGWLALRLRRDLRTRDARAV